MKTTRRRKHFVVDELKMTPDTDQVLRYLGYGNGSKPNPQVYERVSKFLEDLPALQPRAIYAKYPVESCDSSSVVVRGGGKFTGRIGEFMGPGIEEVAVFVTTAGTKVTESAEKAFEAGDAIGGLCWDAVGSHMADAAVQRIIDDLMAALPGGKATTLPFSPGYCGIPLSQQRTLFKLLDASRVGVELLSSYFMKPVKSISGLIGIGPEEQVFSRGNPCDHCGRNDCRMSRSSH